MKLRRRKYSLLRFLAVFSGRWRIFILIHINYLKVVWISLLFAVYESNSIRLVSDSDLKLVWAHNTYLPNRIGATRPHQSVIERHAVKAWKAEINYKLQYYFFFCKTPLRSRIQYCRSRIGRWMLGTFCLLRARIDLSESVRTYSSCKLSSRSRTLT